MIELKFVLCLTRNNCLLTFVIVLKLGVFLFYMCNKSNYRYQSILNYFNINDDNI